MGKNSDTYSNVDPVWDYMVFIGLKISATVCSNTISVVSETSQKTRTAATTS